LRELPELPSDRKRFFNLPLAPEGGGGGAGRPVNTRPRVGGGGREKVVVPVLARGAVLVVGGNRLLLDRLLPLGDCFGEEVARDRRGNELFFSFGDSITGTSGSS